MRSKIAGLIPTLAYQLSVSFQASKPFILKQLEDDRDIFHQSQKHQFMKLIVEPIRAMTKSFFPLWLRAKTLVIVIDGLDECDDKAAMAEFIAAMVDTFSGDPRLPLRIFVTSRVEVHIQEKFEISEACSVTRRLALEKYDANIDIRAFFRSRFSDIRQAKNRLMSDIPMPWPSEQELDTLVEKSGGLFIFAVTLMRFMDDETAVPGESALPQERLRKALTAKVGLDALYQSVLSAAQRDFNFDRVVGTIMLLRSPLPITSLGDLLQLSAEHIVQSVWGIQSILMIPANNNEPIQLFHTSLRDFLIVQERSSSFYINPPIRHLWIVVDCLKAMRIGPKGTIFHGGQKYACLNWCYHVAEGLNENGGDCRFNSPFDTLTSCLADFASQCLVVWVNTMVFEEGWRSLLDVLDLGLSPLKVCALLSLFDT